MIYFPRLMISLLLSSLIGSERENQDKPAGLRTIMLVCFGSTLFTIISILLRGAHIGNYDYGRIIAIL